jgi:hypothetical protein
MMRTTIFIVTASRPVVRTKYEPHATLTVDPVKQEDRVGSVELCRQATFVLPLQDEHLSQTTEAHVQQTGQEVQRTLSRALIEHADRQLVLAARASKAGQGIRLRGIWPSRFKTVFETVEVQRTQVTHRADGSGHTPSAQAWGRPTFAS